MMDHYRIELFRDTRGEWRWRIVQENGQTIGTSDQGYSRRIDALTPIQSLLPEVRIVEVEDAASQ